MDKVKVLDEFFFSQIKAIPIFDHEGHKVGNLRDLAISWENDQPRVTGIKYAKNVQKHIPVTQFANISASQVELSGTLDESSLIPLEPDEIYVGKWLMDKQIIDLKGSKWSGSTIFACSGCSGTVINIWFPWPWISDCAVWPGAWGWSSS